jgi:hypothetical protein
MNEEPAEKLCLRLGADRIKNFKPDRTGSGWPDRTVPDQDEMIRLAGPDRTVPDQDEMIRLAGPDRIRMR